MVLDGNDVGAVRQPPLALHHAGATRREAGDTLYFRGGRYVFTAGVNACATRTTTVND